MNWELIAMIAAALAVSATVVVRRLFRRVYLVPEGHVGLLYQDGKFVGTLEPGRTVRWGRGLGVALHDVRRSLLTVAGQEVLTADHVCLKMSVSVAYQLADAVRAVQSCQHWPTELHHVVQLALRSVTSGMAAEALAGQRQAVAQAMLPLVQAGAEAFGVKIHAVDVRDVMFPADLKRAFAESLRARQEGQAALERARAESAALRNLANAARLLEGNPELQNLRLMQALAASQASGNTLVLGVPGGFVPVRPRAGPPKTPPANEATVDE